MTQAMPLGDKTNWKQIFAEDFTTPCALGHFPDPAYYATKFGVYKSGWKDTTGRGTYRPETVLSCHDSVLDYHLHAANGEQQVATVVPILPGGVMQTGQLYQRHSIRFQVPQPAVAGTLFGYKWVPLLWPDAKQSAQKWAVDGEIDFPEGDLDGTIRAYLHHAGGLSPSDQDAYNTGVLMSPAWHTATTIWCPNDVQFYLDSVLIGHSTSRIPNTAMHLDLQAETSTFGEIPGPTADAHILVDWVVIYAYVPPLGV